MFTLEKAVGALLDRTVTRRLLAPKHTRVVSIGGATLGGSGKTPLAIACASALAASGARVALVGHAYRATPRRARVVSPVDAIEDVGDEALLAARLLEPSGVRVVVAPSRSEAIARAARIADVLVVDGVAQLSPVAATLALLAVDPRHPWGRRRLLPSSASVRAPVLTLAAACDGIVTLGEGDPAAELSELGRSVWPSRVESRGFWLDGWVDEGTLATWEAVRGLRIGLLTALARPERVLASLARRGVVPAAIVTSRDHGPFGRTAAHRVDRAEQLHGIDLWVGTQKCALNAARSLPWLRVAVVDHQVALHPELRTRLRGLTSGLAAGRRCDGIAAAP